VPTRLTAPTEAALLRLLCPKATFFRCSANHDFFFATFLPFCRASDRPMAIACFLLVTFLPLPLFSVPFLRFRIVDSTSFDALFDVLRDDDDFFRGAMASVS
jgi:hypothetical protein